MAQALLSELAPKALKANPVVPQSDAATRTSNQPARRPGASARTDGVLGDVVVFMRSILLSAPGRGYHLSECIPKPDMSNPPWTRAASCVTARSCGIRRTPHLPKR